MTKDQIHDIRGFLCDLIDTQRIHPMLLQIFCGASGRVDLVAERFKALCNTNGLRLVRILYRHNHLLIFRQCHSGAKERLIQCLVECLCNTKALTRGLHLRSKGNLRSAQLLKREYRHLDGNVISRRCKSRLIAKSADRISDNDLRCEIDNRNTGHLADVRHGS